jgi:glycerol-3-phosphate acyltransferase PlsY
MLIPSPALAAAVTCLAGYLLGSINFAVILSRLMAGEDVRTKGSGNAGTTNMLRNFGITPAALTFAGDFSKGCLGSLIGRLLLAPFGAAVIGPYVGGIAAMIGHMKPVFFGFRGGKGSATGLGVLFMIDKVVFLFLAAVGLLISGFSGFVSLASVICAAALPFVLSLYRLYQRRFTVRELVFVLAFGLLILWNHRGNIRRLLAGTENSFRPRRPGKNGGAGRG